MEIELCTVHTSAAAAALVSPMLSIDSGPNGGVGANSIMLSLLLFSVFTQIRLDYAAATN